MFGLVLGAIGVGSLAYNIWSGYQQREAAEDQAEATEEAYDVKAEQLYSQGITQIGALQSNIALSGVKTDTNIGRDALEAARDGTEDPDSTAPVDTASDILRQSRLNLLSDVETVRETGVDLAESIEDQGTQDWYSTLFGSGIQALQYGAGMYGQYSESGADSFGSWLLEW